MKIWEFFENLDSISWAVNTDKHELEYLNKKARDLLGINKLKEGTKCYELFHGRCEACEECNCRKAQTGSFETLDISLPFTDVTVKTKMSAVEYDGVKYTVRMGMDDFEKKAEEAKAARIKEHERHLERMANLGFRAALMADTPDEGIMKILEFLGKALNAERTYIFERNEKGNDDNTYEWCAEGVELVQDLLWDLPKEVCAHWYDNFDRNKNIIIHDLEDIKDSDPLQYENLKRQGIHTLAVVPIYGKDKILGFYGVDNPPVEGLDYSTDVLQVTAHFIVASLRQRDLMRNLHALSRMDQLTGLGNRFAMNDYLAALHENDSLGLVYCDVTGLKRVNDNEGHIAGDRLILRACDCLKSVFEGNGLFRIGGDELLLLCPKISEEELFERVQSLKSEMKRYNVNIAVGSVWNPKSGTDIDGLMSAAEKEMYEDKAEYYRKSGIERRR